MPHKLIVQRERRTYHLPSATLELVKRLMTEGRPTETAVLIEAVKRMATQEGVEKEG